MVIFAMLIIPGIDAIAKWLAGAVSPGQIAFSRFVFQIMFTLPFLFWIPSGRLLTRTLPFHALRGTMIAMATVLFFTGLIYLPIADAIAIFFIEPLLVTLLSMLLFREVVGWRRILAIIVGFGGALIVIRPSFSEVGWAVLYPVSTAFCFSFYILLTRRLVLAEHPIRMQFLTGIFGAVVLAVALVFGNVVENAMFSTVWPNTHQLILLVALGLIAAVAHLSIVFAYRQAPISILAPFQYVEIIGATILGVVFFDDFPELITWLGILLIIGSGAYIFHRESIANQH